LIAAAVLVFYWVPVTSPAASIQWDAADMHYPLQKYFASRLRSGQLPFWTPYIFSGYPLLANPEVAAWYLPHWPFYLLGVTPRAIELELVLHALLACLGAWLFISRVIGNRTAATLGAFAYGLSGFFAGHSSHVGIFSTAACLPWLLLCFRRAVDSAALRFAALGGILGGLMILAGYFQAAMYAYLAVGLYALADLWLTPRRWLRTASIVAGMLAVGIGIAALQILPGLELTHQSIRAGNDFSKSTQGVLQLKALATLLAPDSLGAISGGYTGPGDITQYYFYAGILVLPLAVIGLFKTRTRLPVLCVLIPATWYMLGPAAGLYRLGAVVPGLHQVRAPVQGWFVAALALALAAASGLDWITQRWRVPSLAPVLIAILFADVWYWNSWVNPLAYARSSFDELYGTGEELVRSRIAATQPELSRFDAPRRLTSLGPLDHPLDVGLESTYGYFALELKAYDEYTAVMERNPKLRDGLNVSRTLNVQEQRIDSNPSALPRAYFPKAVAEARNVEESRRAIETLDPAAACIVLAPHPPIRQDLAAVASVVWHAEQSYRIRYRAASPSVLRLSVPWFPGWRAAVAGRECPIVRLDHALVGIIVPAGQGEIDVRFGSNSFGWGLAISLSSLFAAACVLAGHQQWG
jgi:hypothetical protein